jgi:hypothetical protein
MDVLDPESFEEFWPYYVAQHRNTTCRRLHFIGTSAALGLLAVAPVFPPAALAAPIAGYGLAWIGHLVFEKNKPASWHSARHFAWSLRGDLRMWRMTIVGDMAAEVERVEDIYDLAPA